VRDYANILKEANLRPAVVDINAFTVQNIFENRIGFTDDTTVALLNVGAAVTTLNVVSRGASCFTREIANAGNTITEEVRRRCNVSSEQAELFKCVGPEGGAPEEALGAIMHASGTLAGEIQRSIDFFIATNGEQELSKICICGGSAYLEPLARAIEERSRVPVELFDPLVNVAVDAKHVNEQELRSRSAQLVVAMGLALRRDRENRQWSA
jgi:type IV pilus assembly protein PilM